MTEDRYPIPVKRLAGHLAFRLGCNACGDSWDAKDIDDYCEWVEYCMPCPSCSARNVCPAYDEANECPNCKRLGWWNGDHCSRVCVLQTEYAATLRR